MAKKKNQNDDGKKLQKGCGVTVVLKIDLHCEGCAGKIVRAVSTLDGVESVRIGDSELNKLTVIGNVDPVKLRQKVEEKTKKKVDVVISSTTKKPNHCGEKQQKSPPKTIGKKDEKKHNNELPVTRTVLKVPLHCQGCVRRIHKLVSKTKGYMEMSMDKKNDLVTVKGAIDVKLLAEALQHKLKRVVEIVPTINKDNGEGDKKKGGSGEKKKGGGDASQKKGDGGGEKKVEDGKSTTETYGSAGGYPAGYAYAYAYGAAGYAECVHAPQLFSDENPNACGVM